MKKELLLLSSLFILNSCTTEGITPNVEEPKNKNTSEQNAQEEENKNEIENKENETEEKTDPSTTPSAKPSENTSSTLPDGSTGPNSDISEEATFNGKVLDRDFVPIEGATVTAKSIDPGVTWVGESTETINGAYVFRNAPVGTRLQIAVTKPGWTTRVRTEVLKSNLKGDPRANVINFGGLGTDAIYSIQDEPEITSIKVNGKTATGEGTNINGTPNINSSTNISGISSNNLEIEMTFSEPVDRQDFENVFRVNSMVFPSNNRSFDINENLSGVDFTWSEDDTKVVFKTNKALLTNTSGDEARYNIGFEGEFKDKTDKESNEKKIRFTPSTFGDNLVFSLKNDETDPRITGFQAQDGGGNNDKLIINYSESLNVINKSSDAAQLVDPQGNGTARLSWNGNSNGHDFSLLGYRDVNNNNKFSYMVAILRADQNTGKFTAAHKMISLGSNNIGATSINGNTVSIELNSQAFNKDDKVILSAGSPITGKFTFKDGNNVTQTIDLSTSTNVSAATIEDPAGRKLSTSNSSTSGGITIYDNQRVSTGS